MSEFGFQLANIFLFVCVTALYSGHTKYILLNKYIVLVFRREK
jgi:hypothetical protein